MSKDTPFIPHLSACSDGQAAWRRFQEAHAGSPTQVEQVRSLGAEALASAAAVLGVDPIALGFGLRDGQIATALTARAPLISAEIAERRLEIAIACVSGWVKIEARRLRREAASQADQLERLSDEIRQEAGRLQGILYRRGTVRQTHDFVLPREGEPKG